MSDQMQEFAPTSNDESQTQENDLMAEVEKLRSTNERLLQESTKYKTRRSELEEYKAQLEEYKRKELEQKGNFQEMLKMEQEKRLQLENELATRDKRLLKSNIFNAVANYAKDAHDVNDLLAQRDYASHIEIDEDTLEPVSESVHKFVDTLRNEKKYLFKGQKIPPMSDAKVGVEKPKQKPMSRMGKDELKQELAKSLQGLI